MKYNGPVSLDKDLVIEEQPKMRVEKPYDLLIQPKSRTDRGKTINKSPRGLVRPAYQAVESITKPSSKVYKSKTYNEIINDPIHRNR